MFYFSACISVENRLLLYHCMELYQKFQNQPVANIPAMVKYQSRADVSCDCIFGTLPVRTDAPHKSCWPCLAKIWVTNLGFSLARAAMKLSGLEVGHGQTPEFVLWRREPSRSVRSNLTGQFGTRLTRCFPSKRTEGPRLAQSRRSPHRHVQYTIRFAAGIG
jgi:hypothetical protein